MDDGKNDIFQYFENSICARNWPGIGIMRQIQYSLTASRYLNGKHFDPSTFQHLVVNHYLSIGFLSLKKQTEKMGQIYASRFNAFTILRLQDQFVSLGYILTGAFASTHS